MRVWVQGFFEDEEKKREEDSMALCSHQLLLIPDGEKRGHMNGWCSSDPLGMYGLWGPKELSRGHRESG